MSPQKYGEIFFPVQDMKRESWAAWANLIMSQSLEQHAYGQLTRRNSFVFSPHFARSPLSRLSHGLMELGLAQGRPTLKDFMHSGSSRRQAISAHRYASAPVLPYRLNRGIPRLPRPNRQKEFAEVARCLRSCRGLWNPSAPPLEQRGISLHTT
jgi:hypothetical protein